MNLVFTMKENEFKNAQNVRSINQLLKNYDVVPMPNDINLMGFYKRG